MQFVFVTTFSGILVGPAFNASHLGYGARKAAAARTVSGFRCDGPSQDGGGVTTPGVLSSGAFTSRVQGPAHRETFCVVRESAIALTVTTPVSRYR